jgi:hypothetical protein
VLHKITKKRDYLLTYSAINTDLENEHDIKKWINFLPAINPIKTRDLKTVSDDFGKLFLKDMEKGVEGQQDKLNIIKSKIIYFSLAIQELIQSVVSKYIKERNTILLSNTNEPFLENACCDDGKINTFSYFASKESNIELYNRNISILNSYVLDAHRKCSAMTLFEPSDTRTLSMTLDNAFSPNTMYKALIHFCSSVPNLIELKELNEICGNKNELAKNVDKIIKMMSENTAVYDKNVFEKMMISVNSKNLIRSSIKIEEEYKGNKALQEIKERFIPKVESSSEASSSEPSPAPASHYLTTFITLLENIINSKDKEDVKNNDEIESENDAMDNMKDYLTNENKKLLNRITSFLNNYSKNNKQNKETIDCIRQLLIFKETQKEFKERNISEMASLKESEILKEDKDKIYKMESFFKNAAESIVVIFPNMISNDITYLEYNNEIDDDKDIENDVYNRWDISKKHRNDLKNILYKKYRTLNKLDKNILPLCEKKNNDIHFLIKKTIYSNMKDNDKICINDGKTIRMIYQFYLLNIICNIIDIEKINADEKKYTSKFKYDKNTEKPSFDRDGIIKKTPLTNRKFKIKNNKKQIDEDEENIEEKKNEDGNENENNDEDNNNIRNTYVNKTQEISLIITTFIKMLCDNKYKINYNYDSLMDKIIKSKNDEKNKIISILDQMDDEERKVDKEMRLYSLGKWNKGSGRIYTKDRYDEERDELVLSNNVTATDEEIYENEVNEQVEHDELGMENIGEDNDNYGEEQERDYGDYE